MSYLQKLPRLKELGLKSPGYPSNPVGLLCNYSTHVLYHLPDLTRLDQLCVRDSTLKDLSEVGAVLYENILIYCISVVSTRLPFVVYARLCSSNVHDLLIVYR